MRKREDVGGARRLVLDPDDACPTVMAGGVGSVNTGQYTIREREERLMPDDSMNHPNKPPYRVPLMSEVRELPWNGYTVASTFSGAGGSSTGYRMAGFKVLYANEFVPAAQDSYRANMSPDTYLDCRDIHQVTPEDVLHLTGLAKGELDLFDGSPPCQAFSTAGKRHKGWGEKKRYEHGAEQCNETLFGQWLRLLRGLAPRTFVAENVSGLVKGTAKGMFLEILAEMKAAGYRTTCRVLDAQWLGVPQQRQRTIFVGVREDLVRPNGAPLLPAHPDPLPWRYSVLNALPWLNGAVHRSGGFGEVDCDDRPSPAVTATQCSLDAYGAGVIIQKLGFADEPERVSSGAEPSPCVSGMALGAALIENVRVIAARHIEPETIATQQQQQILDMLKAGGSFDEVGEQIGYKGGFGKIKVDAAERSPSVCTSPDLFHPVERRKFSIAELKRICAFPDDFVLTGSYAQQWERLGNSVPPVMMFWIARTIRDSILLSADDREGGYDGDDPSCLVAGTKWAKL